MAIIVAVTGMLNWYLSIPANQDHDLTNLEFIMINQALILAVRLDLLATPPLRALLDLQHMYRQIMLRLQSAAKADADEQDVFHSFLARGQKLQQWWLKHQEGSENSVQVSLAANQEQTTNVMNEATIANNIAELLPGFEDFDWENIQCEFLDGEVVFRR